MRYLRNTVDGFIYEWNEILSRHPKCEEVTEEEAYPERFAPPAVIERARRRAKPLDLSTDDIPEPPVYTPPELSAEAARGWPE